MQGQLLPQDGIIRVYAPDTGIISVKYAKEGGFVRAGETLFALDSERDDGSGSIQRRLIADAELKKSLAEQEIVQRKRIHTNERSTLENTVHRLQIQLSHIKNQAILQQKRITLAEKNLARQRTLAKEGAVSELEKDNYENALLEMREGLDAYRREEAALSRELSAQQGSLNSLSAQQQSEINQLERAVAAYSQEILDYRQRSRQVVRAPVSGYITAANADIGQRADPSRLLAGIVPQNATLQADLYVPSNAIGFIDRNRKQSHPALSSLSLPEIRARAGDCGLRCPHCTGTAGSGRLRQHHHLAKRTRLFGQGVARQTNCPCLRQRNALANGHDCRSRYPARK